MKIGREAENWDDVLMTGPLRFVPADFAGDIVHVAAVFASLCFEPTAAVNDNERSLFIFSLSAVILCYHILS